MGADLATADTKALRVAFVLGTLRRARVNLPAIAMPERSYMRSSLAEMADAIREELSEAVAEAMQ